MIGSEIGKPLYTDKLTRTRERLVYARLMVEVPVFGQRVLEVPITLPTGAQVNLRIVYEALPEFCDKCGRIGHGPDLCQGRSEGAESQGQNGDGVDGGAANGRRPARRRSQSVNRRGGPRRQYRPRPRQQDKGEKQPNQEVNEGNRGEQNQLAMVAASSPIPVAVVPPLSRDADMEEEEDEGGRDDGVSEEGEGGNGQNEGQGEEQPVLKPVEVVRPDGVLEGDRQGVDRGGQQGARGKEPVQQKGVFPRASHVQGGQGAAGRTSSRPAQRQPASRGSSTSASVAGTSSSEASTSVSTPVASSSNGGIGRAASEGVGADRSGRQLRTRAVRGGVQ